jgi:hypothetical protein
VSAAQGGGALTAALLQISQYAERIASLDNRESEHYRHVGDTLAALGESVADLKDEVSGHGQILASLDGIGPLVARLADEVASLLPPAPGPGYNPEPAVQWWAKDLSDEDRAQAVTRLRGWVQRIYRPHYGHLAARLGDCWEQHPLCLVQLDWASELWSVLYLRPTRTAGVLSSQAEFGTRILPAVAEQLAQETSGCGHRKASAAASSWAGAR